MCKTCEENIFVLSLPSNQSDKIMSLIKEALLNSQEYQQEQEEFMHRLAFEERVWMERAEQDAQEAEEIDLYFESVTNKHQ